MPSLLQIELRCPVCDSSFRSLAAAEPGVPAARRTDFHGHAPGAETLPYLVHMCGRCGYAGAAEVFDEDADPLLCVQVWSELAPRLGGAGLDGLAPPVVSGSDKYEAAAKVAEWRAAGSRRVGELYLHAAWCCVEEGDVEAERYYRRKAAWRMAEALDQGDVPPEERAVLTYLVGELWRRIGDQRQAASWLDRVASEIVDARTQEWVVELAAQQRARPREWLS